MNKLVEINNHKVRVKEFKGQRVVTIWDIAMVHGVKQETIRDNFENNVAYMSAVKHYFRVEKDSDFVRDLIRNGDVSQNAVNRANDIPVFTERGYLMIAKPLTGELAWLVQEEMVDRYFAVKNMLESLSPELKVLISMELKQKQLEQEITNAKLQVAQTKEKTQILEHRVNSLDATNINGTPRQRLNDMVRKYAYENGILYPQAWKEFRRSFNTAYRTNLETKKKNYLEKHKIKQLSYPEYLERVGLIEDALRVADKMLNQSKTA
ncbi:MAG TPA: ORF6N domain-containing protein [Clostridiaceae bacterium]|nr:ORF6N domain-containing protein [Clostridiaceae bacterium]